MKTPAIHQAIRLYKHPKEMEWLTFPESELPEGVTDLLHLCASKKQLQGFTKRLQIKEKIFHHILLNFVDEVLLTNTNSDNKLIGLNHNHDVAKRKLHYQLLMKIYHPDRNSSEDAASKASKITKAYQNLKKAAITDFSFKKTSMGSDSLEHRIPPKSFYRATQNAEQSISQVKSSFLMVGTLALASLLTTSVYLYQSINPELIIQNTNEKNIAIANIAHVSDAKSLNSQFTPQLTAVSSVEILEPKLVTLLHQLETFYEKGQVDKIEPILANTPEINQQSSEEISAKLKTLFEITQERKMLLYDFSWKNISGEIYGKGKFLSRYHFAGDDQWLTREGVATVKAQSENNDKNSLKIISLELNNRNIEQ